MSECGTCRSPWRTESWPDIVTNTTTNAATKAEQKTASHARWRSRQTAARTKSGSPDKSAADRRSASAHRKQEHHHRKWRTADHTRDQQLHRTPTACSSNPHQHRQAGFQRHCTINVELRSPKWQLGHLQIKTENRTIYNSFWLLGRNVTSPSASVPT